MEFVKALLSGPTGMEFILRSADAGTVTDIFFVLIAGFFIIALVCYKRDKLRSLTHYTPNLLTSLGMLGTFTGIVIGLLHFDPEDIDGSISLLLGGLQTAFMTSLFGMAMTIFYKIITGLPWLQPKVDFASGPDEIGPEHIHQLLREQNDNLSKLHHAIAGDDSDTLTGQIRLLRQHQDDNHKALVKETSRQTEAAEALGKYAEVQRERFNDFARELSTQMHDFAEMMSKSATEQVINALKEVIQDFNNQLTEQFGENFKALDASVKSLVEWQENYRQQLGEMRDQYAQGVTAITQTEASVAVISEKSKAIPETMSGLETLLTATQRQLDDLESHLAAFKDMRDRAVEAVPEIRRQIEETVSEINQAAKSAAQDLVTGSVSMKDELLQGSARINEEMIEGASGLNERYNRVHESLQGTSDQLSTQSEQIARSFRESHEEVNSHVRNLVEQLTQSSEQMGSRMQEGSERIEMKMQEGADGIGKRFTDMQDTLEGNSNTLKDGAKHLSEEYRKGIESAEKQVQTLIEQITQEHNQMTRALSEASEETQDHLRKTQTSTSEALELLQTQHRKALEDASQQYQTQLSNAYQQVEAAMKQAVNRTGEHINAQMERIDESMQQELQRVMTEMGNALGQISGRFTQDYQKLTNEMQQVVQSSKTGAY